MWYLSKHFLFSATISLSIHKIKKITRRVPPVKSDSIVFSMMDVKTFTTGRGAVEGGGNDF